MTARKRGPRVGQVYAVTPAWQEAVILRLREIGSSSAELARRLGCARSTMSELLHTPKSHSTLVPAVHEALGWAPPNDPIDDGSSERAPVPLPSAEAIEMAHLFDKLTDPARQKIYQDTLFYLSLQNTPAKSAGSAEDVRQKTPALATDTDAERRK